MNPATATPACISQTTLVVARHPYRHRAGDPDADRARRLFESQQRAGAWAKAEEESSPRTIHAGRLLEIEEDRPASCRCRQFRSAHHRPRGRMGGGRLHRPWLRRIMTRSSRKLPPNAQLNAPARSSSFAPQFAKMPGALRGGPQAQGTCRPGRFSDHLHRRLHRHHDPAPSGRPAQIAEWLQHDAWLLAQEGRLRRRHRIVPGHHQWRPFP